MMAIQRLVAVIPRREHVWGSFGRPARGGARAGGGLSLLFVNLALTAFDRHYEAACADKSRYRKRRRHLPDHGHATYQLIRYSDDFVVLVRGAGEQAEALRDEAAERLRVLGLTLSSEKTPRDPRGRRLRLPRSEALTTRSTRHLSVEQISR
jgi:hypothetical protein